MKGEITHSCVRTRNHALLKCLHYVVALGSVSGVCVRACVRACVCACVRACETKSLAWGLDV